MTRQPFTVNNQSENGAGQRAVGFRKPLMSEGRMNYFLYRLFLISVVVIQML